MEPTARANADYRWTYAKSLAFLAALARSGKVAAAARSVGMSRQSAYRLRARLSGTRFAAAWSQAQRAGRVARAAGGGGPR
jgi:molybdenum-dependent DNA-binding transcriptional regulator ModE